MKGQVERFFTKKGFQYKSNIDKSTIIANYTFDCLLSKIYAFEGKYKRDNYTYVLKQIDYKKLPYNIIYNKISSVRDRPIYVLYR